MERELISIAWNKDIKTFNITRGETVETYTIEAEEGSPLEEEFIEAMTRIIEHCSNIMKTPIALETI